MDGLFVLSDLLQRVQRRRPKTHLLRLRSHGLQTMLDETASEEMSVRPNSDQHGFGVFARQWGFASARHSFHPFLLNSLALLSLLLFPIPAAAHPRRIRPALPIRQQMYRGAGDVLEAFVIFFRWSGIRRRRRVESAVEAHAEEISHTHQLPAGRGRGKVESNESSKIARGTHGHGIDFAVSCRVVFRDRQLMCVRLNLLSS